jgi:hypothetical protein
MAGIDCNTSRIDTSRIDTDLKHKKALAPMWSEGLVAEDAYQPS